MYRNLSAFIFLPLCFLICASGASFAQNLPTESSPDTVTPSEKETSAYWFADLHAHISTLGYFNLGVALYKEERLPLALKSFKKVISSKSPLKPAAQYYSALALNKLDRPLEAKKMMNAIELKNLPPHLKSEVMIFKNELFADETLDEMTEEEQEAEKHRLKTFSDFYGFVDLSYGNNSNPDISPGSTVTPSQPDQQSQAHLRLAGDLLQYSQWSLKADYNFSGNFFQKVDAANYSYNDLILPLAYQDDDWSIKIFPEFFIDNYSNAAYSQEVGMNLEVDLLDEDDTWRFGLQNMDIKNETTTYSYLTGTSQKIYLYWMRKFESSQLYSTFSAAKFNYQDTSSLGSSYTEANLYIGYSYFLGNFEFNVGGSYAYRYYIEATSDPEQRLDNRTFLDFMPAYYFSKDFKVYLDFNQTVNQSNFSSSTEDYSYYQKVMVLGMRYFW